MCVQERAFLSSPCGTRNRARSVRGCIKTWCFELVTITRHKVRHFRFFLSFLPEDLWCMYPSQVWRLVCHPGSPPLPRYSGTVAETVCPYWLCEHRGEKNWAAGAVQFPLEGWPLPRHNWSEGKVFRGAKSLLCHSSSGEIQTARTDVWSPEKHISLSNMAPWRGPEGKQSVTHHLCLCAEENSMLIQRWQIQAVSFQASASQQNHCIRVLAVWSKVGEVCSVSCGFLGVR